MASIGLRINQGYGAGVDTGVADVFAKAMFGDPEAAAKVAIAKAQIATQEAAARNYGATTEFTQSKTAQNEAELAARRAGVTPLATLMGANIAPPVARETPRPAPNFQGPMPTVVQPADLARDRAIRSALPGLAEAALVGGGGNAEQIMKSAGVGAGLTGLLAPDPSRVRLASTLYTGTAPSNNATLMPGDTAGAANEIAINAAKPSAEKVIKDPAGNSYVLSVGPDGKPYGTRVEGLPDAPAEGAFAGDSAEMGYNRIITGYNAKKQAGELTTPQEDRDYAIAYNANYGDKIVQHVDPETKELTEVPIRRSAPAGLIVPTGFGDAPASPVAAAPSGAPIAAAPPPSAAPAGAPVPLAAVAPAPEAAPGLPLPAAAAGGSPLLDRGLPVPIGSPPAVPVAASPGPSAAASAPAVVAPPSQPGRDPRVRTLIPATKTGKDLTEQAGRATAFFMESKLNNDYLNGLKSADIPGIYQKFLSDPSREGIVGDIMRSRASGEAKNFQDAATGFTNGYMRLQSGAVIRPDEEKTFQQRYIPQPGDSEARLNAKAIRRQVVLDAMQTIGEGRLPLGPDGKPSMASIEAALQEKYAPELARALALERGGAGGAGGAAGAPGEDQGAPRPRMRFNGKTGKLEPTNG